MTGIDWGVMALYALAVVALGLAGARVAPQTGKEWLLAGRNLPAWAALLSLVATELSAATFIGVPHAAYTGDWSYLQLAVGALLGKAFVAARVLPVYRRRGLVTVYGFLRERFGPRTHRAAALCFVLGRVLASGSRLFIAALAFSVAFSDGWPLEMVIAGCGILAALYTRTGGIRSVVWTDVLQGAVFVVAAGAALATIAHQVDGASLGAVFGSPRTTVLHAPPWLSLGNGSAFLTAVAAGFFLTCATHSTDHDMVQRLLTTRDVAGAQRALRISALLNFPLSALFLAIGTGLFAYYSNGEAPEDVRRVFAVFARDVMPAGLRGLVFAGLFAAAMSSLDSAICAIAATWVSDVRPRAEDSDAAAGARTKRVCDAVALALVVAACAMARVNAGLVRDGGGPDLVEFALSSMSILYGGLLGIFALGLADAKRGSDASTLAGLAVGALLGLGFFLGPLIGFGEGIAWGWRIPIAAAATAAVAACGRSGAGASRGVALG